MAALKVKRLTKKASGYTTSSAGPIKGQHKLNSFLPKGKTMVIKDKELIFCYHFGRKLPKFLLTLFSLSRCKKTFSKP